MNGRATMTDQKDYWTKDGAFYVCDGQKYGLAPSGSTVCVGSVPGASQTLPVAEKVVLQQDTKGIALTAPKPVEVLQQKHRGGRPRKEGEVHRSTKWRREKAEQGVLI